MSLREKCGTVQVKRSCCSRQRNLERRTSTCDHVILTVVLLVFTLTKNILNVFLSRWPIAKEREGVTSLRHFSIENSACHLQVKKVVKSKPLLNAITILRYGVDTRTFWFALCLRDIGAQCWLYEFEKNESKVNTKPIGHQAAPPAGRYCRCGRQAAQWQGWSGKWEGMGDVCMHLLTHACMHAHMKVDCGHKREVEGAVCNVQCCACSM